MDRLRKIVFETDTKAGLYFDITIQILIAVSLVSFSIETLPGLSDSTYDLLANIEFVIVIIFSIEYILRVILSERKLSYIFSFYGIVDLVAILPFYLSGSISLQSLRALRFIRIFRILKIARYSKAISRIGKALAMAKEELILFGFLTLILLYLSAIGIYHFEHDAQPEVFKSVFDSLWWAVATLTTVGYGDVYPITIGGRTFTFIVLMLGLGVVAVPTGIISSALSAARRAEK
jgi:voltage-gated potassium channel